MIPPAINDSLRWTTFPSDWRVAEQGAAPVAFASDRHRLLARPHYVRLAALLDAWADNKKLQCAIDDSGAAIDRLDDVERVLDALRARESAIGDRLAAVRSLQRAEPKASATQLADLLAHEIELKGSSFFEFALFELTNGTGVWTMLGFRITQGTVFRLPPSLRELWRTCNEPHTKESTLSRLTVLARALTKHCMRATVCDPRGAIDLSHGCRQRNKGRLLG